MEGPEDHVCNTCLSRDRKLFGLEPQQQAILTTVLGITVSNDHRLCWECCAMLKNIEKFQRKAKFAQVVRDQDQRNTKHNYVDGLSGLQKTKPFRLYTIANTNEPVLLTEKKSKEIIKEKPKPFVKIAPKICVTADATSNNSIGRIKVKSPESINLKQKLRMQNFVTIRTRNLTKSSLVKKSKHRKIVMKKNFFDGTVNDHAKNVVGVPVVADKLSNNKKGLNNLHSNKYTLVKDMPKIHGDVDGTVKNTTFVLFTEEMQKNNDSIVADARIMERNTMPGVNNVGSSDRKYKHKRKYNLVKDLPFTHDDVDRTERNPTPVPFTEELQTKRNFLDDLLAKIMNHNIMSDPNIVGDLNINDTNTRNVKDLPLTHSDNIGGSEENSTSELCTDVMPQNEDSLHAEAGIKEKNANKKYTLEKGLPETYSDVDDNPTLNTSNATCHAKTKEGQKRNDALSAVARIAKSNAVSFNNIGDKLEETNANNNILATELLETHIHVGDTNENLTSELLTTKLQKFQQSKGIDGKIMKSNTMSGYNNVAYTQTTTMITDKNTSQIEQESTQDVQAVVQEECDHAAKSNNNVTLCYDDGNTNILLDKISNVTETDNDLNAIALVEASNSTVTGKGPVTSMRRDEVSVTREHDMNALSSNVNHLKSQTETILFLRGDYMVMQAERPLTLSKAIVTDGQSEMLQTEPNTSKPVTQTCTVLPIMPSEINKTESNKNALAKDSLEMNEDMVSADKYSVSILCLEDFPTDDSIENDINTYSVVNITPVSDIDSNTIRLSEHNIDNETSDGEYITAKKVTERVIEMKNVNSTNIDMRVSQGNKNVIVPSQNKIVCMSKNDNCKFLLSDDRNRTDKSKKVEPTKNDKAGRGYVPLISDQSYMHVFEAFSASNTYNNTETPHTIRKKKKNLQEMVLNRVTAEETSKSKYKKSLHVKYDSNVQVPQQPVKEVTKKKSITLPIEKNNFDNLSQASKNVLFDHCYCLKNRMLKDLRTKSDYLKKPSNNLKDKIVQKNARNSKFFKTAPNQTPFEMFIKSHYSQKVIEDFENIEINAVEDEPDNNTNRRTNRNEVLPLHSSEYDLMMNVNDMEEANDYAILTDINGEEYHPLYYESSNDTSNDSIDWCVQRCAQSGIRNGNACNSTTTVSLDKSHENEYETNPENDTEQNDFTDPFEDSEPIYNYYQIKSSEYDDYNPRNYDYENYEVEPSKETTNDPMDFESNNITVTLPSFVNESEDMFCKSTDEIIDDENSRTANIFDLDNRNTSPDLLEPRYFAPWKDSRYDHVLPNQNIASESIRNKEANKVKNILKGNENEHKIQFKMFSRMKSKCLAVMSAKLTNENTTVHGNDKDNLTDGQNCVTANIFDPDDRNTSPDILHELAPCNDSSFDSVMTNQTEDFESIRNNESNQGKNTSKDNEDTSNQSQMSSPLKRKSLDLMSDELINNRTSGSGNDESLRDNHNPVVANVLNPDDSNASPDLLEPRYFAPWKDSRFDHVLTKNKYSERKRKKVPSKDNKQKKTKRSCMVLTSQKSTNKNTTKTVNHESIKSKRKCENSNVGKNVQNKSVCALNLEQLLQRPIVLLEKIRVNKKVSSEDQDEFINKDSTSASNDRNLYDASNASDECLSTESTNTKQHNGDMQDLFTRTFSNTNVSVSKKINASTNTNTRERELKSKCSSVPILNKNKDQIIRSARDHYSEMCRQTVDKTRNKHDPSRRGSSNIFTLRLLQDGELENIRQKFLQEKSFKKANYKCNKCILTFANTRSSIVHFKNYHENSSTDLICEVCECGFKDQELFKMHTESHKSVYRCSWCCEEYMFFKSLLIHVRYTHPEHRKIYTCKTCHKEYYNPVSLWSHEKQHKTHSVHKRTRSKSVNARVISENMSLTGSNLSGAGNITTDKNKSVTDNDLSCNDTEKNTFSGTLSELRKRRQKSEYTENRLPLLDDNSTVTNANLSSNDAEKNTRSGRSRRSKSVYSTKRPALDDNTSVNDDNLNCDDTVRNTCLDSRRRRLKSVCSTKSLPALDDNTSVGDENLSCDDTGRNTRMDNRRRRLKSVCSTKSLPALDDNLSASDDKLNCNESVINTRSGSLSGNRTRYLKSVYSTKSMPALDNNLSASDDNLNCNQSVRSTRSGSLAGNRRRRFKSVYSTKSMPALDNNLSASDDNLNCNQSIRSTRSGSLAGNRRRRLKSVYSTKSMPALDNNLSASEDNLNCNQSVRSTRSGSLAGNRRRRLKSVYSTKSMPALDNNLSASDDNLNCNQSIRSTRSGSLAGNRRRRLKSVFSTKSLAALDDNASLGDDNLSCDDTVRNTHSDNRRRRLKSVYSTKSMPALDDNLSSSDDNLNYSDSVRSTRSGLLSGNRRRSLKSACSTKSMPALDDNLSASNDNLSCNESVRSTGSGLLSGKRRRSLKSACSTKSMPALDDNLSASDDNLNCNESVTNTRSGSLSGNRRRCLKSVYSTKSMPALNNYLSASDDNLNCNESVRNTRSGSLSGNRSRSLKSVCSIKSLPTSNDNASVGDNNLSYDGTVRKTRSGNRRRRCKSVYSTKSSPADNTSVTDNKLSHTDVVKSTRSGSLLDSRKRRHKSEYKESKEINNYSDTPQDLESKRHKPELTKKIMSLWEKNLSYRSTLVKMHSDDETEKSCKSNYVCKICNKQYVRWGMLLNHWKTRHKGQTTNSNLYDTSLTNDNLSVTRHNFGLPENVHQNHLEKGKLNDNSLTRTDVSLISDGKQTSPVEIKQPRNSKHICKICHKQFKSQVVLWEHLERHHDNRYAKARHDETVKSKRTQNFKCNICQVIYKNWMSLRKHQKRHHETEDIQHSNDAKHIETRDTLSVSNDNFSATKCNLSVTQCNLSALEYNLSLLKDVQQSHRKTDKLKKCPNKIKRISKYKCDLCHRLYKNLRTLRKHQKHHHKTEGIKSSNDSQHSVTKYNLNGNNDKLSVNNVNSSVTGDNLSVTQCNLSTTKCRSRLTDDNLSVTNVNSSVTNDNLSVNNVNSSVTGDNLSVTQCNLSTTKCRSRLTDDNLSVTNVNSSVTNDNLSVNKVNSSVINDSLSVNNVNSSVTNDNLNVTKCNLDTTKCRSSVTEYNLSLPKGAQQRHRKTEKKHKLYENTYSNCKVKQRWKLNKRKFPCKICQRQCRSKKNLRKHVMEKHKSEYSDESLTGKNLGSTFDNLSLTDNNSSLPDNNLSLTDNNLSLTHNNISLTPYNNLTLIGNYISKSTNYLFRTTNYLSSKNNIFNLNSDRDSLTDIKVCSTDNNLSVPGNNLSLFDSNLSPMDASNTTGENLNGTAKSSSSLFDSNLSQTDASNATGENLNRTAKSSSNLFDTNLSQTDAGNTTGENLNRTAKSSSSLFDSNLSPTDACNATGENLNRTAKSSSSLFDSNLSPTDASNTTGENLNRTPKSSGPIDDDITYNFFTDDSSCSMDNDVNMVQNLNSIVEKLKDTDEDSFPADNNLIVTNTKLSHNIIDLTGTHFRWADNSLSLSENNKGLSDNNFIVTENNLTNTNLRTVGENLSLEGNSLSLKDKSNSQPNRCNVCGMSFKLNVAYRRHIASAHASSHASSHKDNLSDLYLNEVKKE